MHVDGWMSWDHRWLAYLTFTKAAQLAANHGVDVYENLAAKAKALIYLSHTLGMLKKRVLFV